MAKKFHTVTVTPTISTAGTSANEILFNLTEIPQAVYHHGGAAKLVSITVQDKGDDLNTDFALYFFKSNAGGDLGILGGGISISDADMELNKPLGVVHVQGIAASDPGDYFAGLLTTLTDVNLIVEAEPGTASIYVGAKATNVQTKEAEELVFTFGVEIL